MEVAPPQVRLDVQGVYVGSLLYSGHYIWTSLCDVHLATLAGYDVYADILGPRLSFNCMVYLENFLVCRSAFVMCLDNIRLTCP